MLRLEDIHLHIGPFELALSAQVAPADRIAILGASGSGKSSLLSLIAGFHWPDHGRVLYGEHDITRHPVAARPVSILFQDGNLFPHMSAFDNVALGLRPDLRLSQGQKDQVAAALARVGLGGMGHRLPRDLSGGQQSRVAIARLVLRDKPLAVLDEPFAALDPGLRRDMVDLLHEICAEKCLGLIMATHDLRDAERMCNRLWYLERGRLMLDIPTLGLRDAPPPDLFAWL
jgi:thiamine transport system ATP-binding protein